MQVSEVNVCNQVSLCGPHLFLIPQKVKAKYTGLLWLPVNVQRKQKYIQKDMFSEIHALPHRGGIKVKYYVFINW